MKILLSVLCLIVGVGTTIAQNRISGTITDTDQQSLPGASVLEKGTTNGTIADFDGKYTLVAADDATLVISFVGYETQEIAVAGKSEINVLLKSKELEEVIIVGTRTAPRSNTDSPLPVDVLSAREITSTGQVTFDKALQYRIPSFNTVQTPVNDATSLLDPYEIRNMGPSRTLILINGKRKNLSSLLYVQTSPGRGETGADISAIPTDAIKRVEILRDGASAQYGSDAIAGVMNIILKDDARDGSVTLRSGISAQGDGAMIGLSLNNGSSIGNGKGFINYTIDFSKVGLANRPSTVSPEGDYQDLARINPDKSASYVDSDGRLDGQIISNLPTDQVDAIFENYKAKPEYTARLAEINTANAEVRPLVDDFLARHPDALNVNGSPATTSAKFLVNGGIDLSSNVELYFNAAYVYKKANSFANYRTPYWRQLSDFPYAAQLFPNSAGRGGYDGYGPTFDGDLSDYNGTIGFAAHKNDWNYDMSFTVGGNKQIYRVSNSFNSNEVLSPSTWVDANGNGVVDAGEVSQSSSLYEENSPTSFSPGGTEFNHIVGNIDINRALSDKVSIGFGAEFRSEFFTVIEGDLASYDGGGADSFAGNRPENSGTFNRYNFGGYFDIAWDIFDDLLLNGTARIENYSDFGDAFVWKVSSRYKFLDDKMTVRASFSTGFRAPTLHQIYTQKSQYSFVAGEGIQVGGIVNNVSPQAKLLGIPQLKAEQSTNITVGIGAKINRKMNITLDYYNIAVKDRILLSTEISKTDARNTALDQLLTENNLSDLSFFINGIDTRTSGLDLVFSYRNIEIGKGFLGVNVSANYTLQNEREGAVKNPTIIQEAEQSVVNQTQEALFFTSRPLHKEIVGLNYEIGKFYISLNNTVFGPTTFEQDNMDENLKTEFLTKVVTDLGVSFSATKKLTVSVNFNNLLNILPEWKFVAKNAAGQAIIDDQTITSTGLTPIQNESNLITFNQRYAQMTYDGFHFSQLGALFNLSVNYKF